MMIEPAHRAPHRFPAESTLGVDASDRLQGIDPREPRHQQVEQHQVRGQSLELAHGFGPVRGLARHPEAGRLQDLARAGAHQRCIVG